MTFIFSDAFKCWQFYCPVIIGSKAHGFKSYFIIIPLTKKKKKKKSWRWDSSPCNLEVIFSSPGQKTMWAFAITWGLSSVNLSHFNLLLWNLLAKWTETWLEASYNGRSSIKIFSFNPDWTKTRSPWVILVSDWLKFKTSPLKLGGTINCYFVRMMYGRSCKKYFHISCQSYN